MTGAAYVAIWWCVVESTFVEVVFLHVDDLWTVELVQDGHQSPSVPVVSHSSAVVALSRQVRQSGVLNFLHRTMQISANNDANCNKNQWRRQNSVPGEA